MDGEGTQDDRERVRRDPARFGELVAIHRTRLRRMVDLRLDARLRGRLDASDVVQEACAEAVQRLQEWLATDGPPLHLWLRLLTEQKLRQLYRFHVGAAMRDAGRELPLADDVTSVKSERMVDAIVESGVLSPSGVAVRSETRAQLLAALETMKADDREILALRHFEQLENIDIARLLGISESGASHRYLRAARRLREILQEVSGLG